MVATTVTLLKLEILPSRKLKKEQSEGTTTVT
jgi:hypothetical protein